VLGGLTESAEGVLEAGVELSEERHHFVADDGACTSQVPIRGIGRESDLRCLEKAQDLIAEVRMSGRMIRPRFMRMPPAPLRPAPRARFKSTLSIWSLAV